MNCSLKIILITMPLVLGALFIGSSYYYLSPLHSKITTARAVVYPTKDNSAQGIVTFVAQKDGLHITAQLRGLKAGVHGFHIHEFGDCACDDGTCAGDHYNPTKQPHAAPTVEKRHVGDLGNIIADEHGNATYDYVDKHAQLNGPHSIIGRSIILHLQADDFTTQPSGNAGARVGCGVIGIAK